MSQFTNEEKLAAIQREIKLRERVYPKWIDKGRMTEAAAEREIAIMKAIEQDYVGKIQPSLFDTEA